MVLKELIAKVEKEAARAMSAYNAGHHDVAENYLMEQMLETCAYFDGKITLPESVTESATSEKPEDAVPATPAEVPGPAVHQAEDGPVLPASQFGGSLTDEKPSQ